MSKTKYYYIRIFTPSDKYYEDCIPVSGSTERQCLDEAKEIAANFSNNMANYEYNMLKEDRGYPTYEEYLQECGWSVLPVSEADFRKFWS